MQKHVQNQPKKYHYSNNHFCNNCGKPGHIFSNCERPITSYGLVAFKRIENTTKYLMICRKDSLGYIEFLRGRYPLYNKEYIQSLVDEMTVQEKNKLLNDDFKQLWHELWGDYVGIQYRGEEKSANDKFTQINRGIHVFCGETYNLTTLIENSKTKWTSPEWGFPKGRRNYQESDLNCAIREFNEETGYKKSQINVIGNIQPVEEIFMGSNYKSYNHKYYICNVLCDDLAPPTSYQKSEVSDIKWLTLDECCKYIRPYNLEKKMLIENINKALHKYRLIS